MGISRLGGLVGIGGIMGIAFFARTSTPYSADNLAPHPLTRFLETRKNCQRSVNRGHKSKFPVACAMSRKRGSLRSGRC